MNPRSVIVNEEKGISISSRTPLFIVICRSYYELKPLTSSLLYIAMAIPIDPNFEHIAIHPEAPTHRPIVVYKTFVMS